MKQVIVVLMVLVGGLALSTAAIADDADDVRAAVLKLNEAGNSGDVDAIAQYLHQERSLFSLAGRLLINFEGFNKDARKAAYEAGLKVNRSWRHLDVKVYGNAAVVTGYHVGRTTRPDGSYIQGARRVSEFWTKQNGQWKLVHRHASQSEPAPRERMSAPPESTNGR